MRTWTRGMTWAAAAGAALVAGAAAPDVAGAQTPAAGDSARRGGGGSRAAVEAMVTRSDAFRDSVTAAMDQMDFDYGPRRRSRLAQRFLGGLTLSVSQPVGPFRRFAGVGFGVTANGVAGIDGSGILGLRVEGGAQNYGRFSTPFQQNGLLFSIPGRQVTSNDIYWGAIGPQLSVPLGPVRPYGFATVGIANFSTTSRLLGAGLDGAGQQFVRSTDLSNWSTTQALGGGLRVRVARQSGTAVHLDLSARRHYVRSARFLSTGAVPGQTALNLLSTQGRADFVTYNVGFSVGGR